MHPATIAVISALILSAPVNCVEDGVKEFIGGPIPASTPEGQADSNADASVPSDSNATLTTGVAGAPSDALPKVVSEGKLKVGNLEITVIQLDNGQRIIPEDDMVRFLEWLTGENAEVGMNTKGEIEMKDGTELGVRQS